jgi:hypothetical protein
MGNKQGLRIKKRKGTSGNLLWKWGAEKIPAGEAINAKLSGDSGRFSNEDSGDFIKLKPA